MTNKASKFISRAPRYVLTSDDNHFFRFANKNDTNSSFETVFVNLSETGLAFLTHKAAAPKIGAQIKMEIPLGKDEKIAWWGTVMRIEPIDTDKWWLNNNSFTIDNSILIGIRFESLPEQHKTKIHSYIKEKFKKINKERKLKAKSALLSLISKKAMKLSLYLLFTIIALILLYWLSKPTANYDGKIGSPWGERFKQFSED